MTPLLIGLIVWLTPGIGVVVAILVAVSKSVTVTDVADLTIEELPSKRHALDRERELIWELRPEHNKLVRSPLPAVVSALAAPD